MVTWAPTPRDALALVVRYLAAALPSATVSTRVEHRDGMVTVEQVGGNREMHVLDDALIVIQAWSPKPAEASRLCREAFAALLSMRHDQAHGSTVRDVESFALPGRFDDPVSRSPRYQATVRIHLTPERTGATP